MTHLRGGAAARHPGLLLAALLLAVFFWAGASHAQEGEYTVSRIPVDVTAASASAARDKALLEAQREGLNRLAERFGAPPPQVSEKGAQDFVMSLEIDGEKSSAVRYIAEVTVHYNPVAVNRLFNRTGEPAAAPAARAGREPILVVPLYEWSGSPSLWDRSNPWFLAWTRSERTINGRPILLPEGSAADVATLTPEQAAAGDRAALTELARRYGAPDALLARARFEIDHAGGGRPAFRLSLTGYGNRLGGLRATDHVDGAPSEFVDELAVRAVGVAVAAVEQARTTPTPAQAGGPTALLDGAPKAGSPSLSEPGQLGQDIAIAVPLRGPADLVSVRQQLARLPMVVRDELISLSRDRATLRVHYRGDAERLRIALAEGGLVAEDDGPGWTLRRGPAGEAGPGQSSVARPIPR